VDRGAIAQAIEHSLLKPDATRAEIASLCAEAREHGFYSVCVQPVHVAVARRELAGTGVRVTTVVSFPLGVADTRTKAREAMQAVLAGADECDMVMDIGAAKEGDWRRVCGDILSVVMAAPEALHKVIIECCYLADEEKRNAALAAVESGAHFVKTSTGFGPGGATVADVELLARTVKGRARVKAAGGIRTLADVRAMLGAGASLIGTSSGVGIMAELDREAGA
jgi:deoxyribose-phosphate aldolase